MIKQTTFDLTKRVFRIISKKGKLFILIGLIFAIFSGFCEVIILRRIPLFLEQIRVSSGSINISSGFTLIIFSLLAMFTRISALFMGTKSSEIIGTELSIKAYETIIRLPYKIILEQNIESISSKMQHINKISSGIIRPLQEIIYYFLISIIILFNLFTMNRYMTTFAILSIGIYYFTIVFISKNFVKKISINTGILSSSLLKNLITSLRSIRTIKLDKTESQYIRLHKNLDQNFRKFISKAILISSTPRFILENLIVLLSVLVCLITIKMGFNIFNIISFSYVAVFVVAFQKLIPAFQQIYGNFTVVRANDYSLRHFFDLIDCKNPKSKKKLNIKIKYSQKKSLISNVKYINLNTGRETFLNLSYGDRIAINAPSGSGKSTFLDILMGLREDLPCDIVFNKNNDITKNASSPLGAFINWQNQISCVSQEVLIAGESFEEIITGRKDQNFQIKNFKDCLEVVELRNLKKRFKNLNKLNLNIGLQGGLISGGERQRLGIARALYKKKKFLFLDEATSNLDEELSRRILLKLIKNKDIYLIIAIIHNKNLLDLFDKVIDI